ncbi:MAG: carboxypeptidase regulatory-like domain-containing protein, partial [Candidatus Acidiferrales bacterium]
MLRKLHGYTSFGWGRKLPLGIAAGFLMAILMVCVNTGSAQVLYGDLTGNVTDQTGAVVANASVETTNSGTGLATDTKTDDHGVFEFTDLTPGVYKLTITATGFGTSVENGLRVEANNVVRADTVLAVSGTTDTVTVTATAPVLQADRADVHTDLNTTELSNLPLNSSQGRNFQILYKVIPGFSTPTEQNSAGANPQRAMTSYVNGQSDQGNTMRIDGMTDVYNYLPANVAYVPPPDSIETVNVVTDAFDAEQGMAGGAAINVTIKSGTNQF